VDSEEKKVKKPKLLSKETNYYDAVKQTAFSYQQQVQIGSRILLL
jgi:hypothetical protein